VNAPASVPSVPPGPLSEIRPTERRRYMTAAEAELLAAVLYADEVTDRLFELGFPSEAQAVADFASRLRAGRHRPEER
jgi:hypothetical protein